MCQCLHLQELHLDVKGKQGRSRRLFIIISKLMDVNRMLIENSINAALRDKKWLQIFMNSSDISYHIVNVLIMTEQLVHVHHEVLWQLMPCHSRGNVNQLSQAFELPLQITSSSWVTSETPLSQNKMVHFPSHLCISTYMEGQHVYTVDVYWFSP